MFRRILDGAALLIVISALFVLARIALEKRTQGPSEAYIPVEAETEEWFYQSAATGRWRGPRDARVTVLVFSSYLCGHCVHFSETLRVLGRRYPQHVAVVFKHFVPPEATDDLKIPLGAECAADQGRFWEYHWAAFQAGRLKTYSNGWRTLAASVDIPDLRDFEVCVRGGRHKGELGRDYLEGVSVGVEGTPTFFINAIGPYVGAAPLARLDSLVTAHFPRRGSPPG